MGWACAAAGMPGMTVSLQMRYHRPVPLEFPLQVLAHVTGTEGRKVYVSGSITTEDDLSGPGVGGRSLLLTGPRTRPSSASRPAGPLRDRPPLPRQEPFHGDYHPGRAGWSRWPSEG
ncbi:hypothetical protein OTB20_17315 [Streptomyces sp. H27-H1]|uniref:PaaI family thioesterase n=1 Tax=Streptomyces sp. H27-H1 TaxID=2996461 RepID=UPI00226E441E|nr:hotdog domain-containing protein [Streptomyces sp. H27-H1]MCY0927936.1 hypothetical protein [Streptomyces sp. H27-H1]